jgi:L-asparaginase
VEPHFARKNGFEPFLRDSAARAEYEAKLKTFGTGTVGCVVLDSKGKIAVATSTGGKGLKFGTHLRFSYCSRNYANEFWCELDWSRRRYCE